MVRRTGAVLTKLEEREPEVGGRQQTDRATTEDENTLITLIDSLW